MTVSAILSSSYINSYNCKKSKLIITLEIIYFCRNILYGLLWTEEENGGVEGVKNAFLYKSHSLCFLFFKADVHSCEDVKTILMDFYQVLGELVL